MITVKCGDAFKLISEIEDCSVDLIFTDPPYDDETYMDRLTDVQKTVLAEQFWRVLKPDGNLALFCGLPDHFKWYRLLTDKGFKFKRELIWVYKNPCKAKLRITKTARNFIAAHETILWFVKGDNYYFNNQGVVELSWFENPAFSGFRRNAEGNPEEKLGVTPKPLKLAQIIVHRLCRPQGIVFDPFMGYGTFAIASLMLNKSYIGFEIRPEIFEIAQKRIESYRNKRITEYVEW